MNTGIYVHFFFCRQKCDYCDFYSIPLAKNTGTTISTYIEALRKETGLLEEKLAKCFVDTIYLGGGTPTIMGADDVAGLLDIIRSTTMGVDVNAEITIECNPIDMNSEYIEKCVSAGINRVTLGLQTINQEHHRLIGRRGQCPGIEVLQQFCDIEHIVHAVDIIAGIPGQGPEQFSHEIKQVLHCGPEHLSLYMLTREEGTPFYNRFKPHETWNDQQRDIFEEAIKIIKSYGYRHYEISNFALPGYESRHNMKYWKYDPYIGLGPGAHSFFDGIRWYNRADVKEYLQHPDTMQVIDSRNNLDMVVEYLLSGIRLLDGFYLEDITEKTGMEIPAPVYDSIRTLSVDDMLEIDESPVSGTLVRLTHEGIFQLDSIIYSLVQELL